MEKCKLLFKSFLIEFLLGTAVLVVAVIIVPDISSATAGLKTSLAFGKAIIPLTLAENLHKWCIGKLQLPIGDAIQFTPDRIVMNHFLMPVAVGKLHVIGDGIGKA